ncbi:MAG: bifunctional hydroxymethylpyrimidine kinase/phosphomethylpyrimidine kinase [Chthoniobacterales bacterium]|nr:bifunctional hydroxymethylpyrimidine kinase/phosphomethylpyrimidine kinase [Chthoniobacterales bacterium]
MSLLIVGSVGIDTVKTPVEERFHLLGGAASYCSVSASFFVPPRLVGIVGEDFPQKHLDDFKKCQIDLEGLQILPGKTFHWSGEYFGEDLGARETRVTELNVFENFIPTLPSLYRQSQVVLLGNIAPQLQQHVLGQVERPHFVIADTMNYWISSTLPALQQLLKSVDLLLINESEARELTKESNLIKAGRTLLSMGPRYVVIKKGEHGALLFDHEEIFSCPAFPLEKIVDPTGAGDAFAGGVAGYLASRLNIAIKGDEIDKSLLREAVVYGSVMASFTVESFSLEKLHSLNTGDIEKRFQTFRRLSAF